MQPNPNQPTMHNPIAIAPDQTFNNTWPFSPNYSNAPGFKMHYVDVGSGPKNLLLLHGEPTWAYLFRNQIPYWAKLARVIAPDHMGFGKSETPTDRSYWLQDHIDNLESLVLDLNLSNITLIMHDFGGPVGMGLAARHPDRISQIISINAPTPFGQPNLLEQLTKNIAEAPWFQWILKAHQQNTLDQTLSQLDYNILSTLKLNGFLNNNIITETWLDAYRAPFPTPAHTAGALGWAKGLAVNKHQFESPHPAAIAHIKSLPALAIWGAQDKTLIPDHFLPLFSQLFPDAPIQLLPNAAHYSLEDEPDQTTSLVKDFLT